MDRAPGRPETDPAYRLAAKAWFIAVSQASGMNASQLEVLFADPRKKQVYRKGKGPGLWNKYQRGRACPNTNERSPDNPSLPSLVERKYPGTKQWLTMPFWKLLSAATLDMAELKEIYLSLPPEVGDVIIHSSYEPENIFWRSQSAPEVIYEKLVRIGTVSAATAILALIKEAETTQNQRQHILGLTAWAQCSSSLIENPVIGSLVGEINGFVDRKFRIVSYLGLGNPGELYCLGQAARGTIWREHGPNTATGNKVGPRGIADTQLPP